nr:RHS repeat-associated core domain-containing protein [Microbulbifer variabilis]
MAARSFTRQEHFDQAGLIPMKGRIYNPVLGRFMQADPQIDGVRATNRYSYVRDNPMALTDLTVYCSLGENLSQIIQRVAKNYACMNLVPCVVSYTIYVKCYGA